MKIDCKFFEDCSCPLCPLINPNGIWYSTEDICKNDRFKTISHTMRKLKKIGAHGYFTLEMLNRDYVVRKGLKGIDPEIPLDQSGISEIAFIRKHRGLSAQSKLKRSEHGKKSVALINRSLLDKKNLSSSSPEHITTIPDDNAINNSDSQGGSL